MSHFAVLVIGDNVEEQMAPFQENNMGDCPQEYLEFHNEDTPENRKEWEEDTVERWRQPDGRLLPSYDDEFRVKGTIGTTFTSDPKHRSHIPTGEKVDVPLKEIYPEFASFMETYHGYKPCGDNGEFGYWENPNAKWDYWRIGGRWAGRFLPKEGATSAHKETASWEWTFGDEKEDPHEGGLVDQIRMGDWNIEGQIERNLQKAIKDWDEFQAKIADIEEDKRGIEYFMSGMDKDETREDFLTRRAAPITCFAVLKDGEWYEKGSMGWWACVSNEKDKGVWEAEVKKLVMGLPDDSLLTIVDCHI